MDDRLDRLRALASAQDGQFATAQALELGLTRSALRALADRRETVRLRRGVQRFRVASGEADPAIGAFLACWPDGVISHGSAARFHRLARVAPPDAPEVTVPMKRRRVRAGVTVHVSRSLPASDVLRVATLRYTSLARTVCDLADAGDPWESLALLDDAVALGANVRWLHDNARRLAGGRDGVALIRDATRPGAAAAFRSWLERAAAHVYRAAALPEPEWNVPVRDGDGLIGIVDALWRPWRVVSEKEGLRFHTTPRQRREDARRFNRLGDAGYQSRRFTWEDVVRRPVEVAATVSRALRAAGAPLDPACIPATIMLPGRPFTR